MLEAGSSRESESTSTEKEVFLMTGFFALVIALVAVLMIYMIAKGHIKVGEKWMTWTILFLAAVAVYGGYGTYQEGTLTVIHPSLGAALAIEPGPPMPTLPTGAAITPVTPLVETPAPAGAVQKQITTFNIQYQEKYSGKFDQVGNESMGYFEVYPENVDPKSPNANPIFRINITSGTGSYTNPNILTDKNYRAVLNGGDHVSSTHAGGWYSVDYGIVQFAYKDFNPSTGTYLWTKNEIARMATISDPIDASNNASYINGQTTCEDGEEIVFSGINNTIVYDESAGDESWWFTPLLEVSGGNRELQGFVMCWDNDDTNNMEGDEITSIIASWSTGTNYGLDPEQVDEWSLESCIDLTGGTGVAVSLSGRPKLLFTMNEDNLATDGTDIFYLRLDDLSGWQAKDVVNNKGADYQTITFHATA